MRRIAGCQLFLVWLLTAGVAGQDRASSIEYQPRWESLDRRPAPEWFLDAKFGIFIHWGVYSVPAFTHPGGYAEWYYRSFQRSGSEAQRFHHRVFGTDFRYEQFAPRFKAELFEPDAWARILARSGARYVVLTSKHHDGFCLWPSPHRPGWNSVATGPCRDLVGDLTAAVRKTGLRMGLYYSLAEWTHPLYTWTFPRAENNPQRYVTEHMIPQFKDLVTRYQPSLLFMDGEWDHRAAEWHSEDLMAWLFNRPELRDELVVNDRWGSDTRFKHGTYFATEYTKGMENTDHPWEECRGMGASFGYNRNETAESYASARQLIQMLVRLVSNGGNLLLNIGPAADGRIPEIMEERLLQMGEWLARNGEAIYGTRRWKHAGEGDELRYTASRDGATIYAIATRWPGPVLNLRKVRPRDGSSVRLLGVEEPLAWRFDTRDGLFIEIPDRLRDRFDDPLSAAYALVIDGAEAPVTPPPAILTPEAAVTGPQLFIERQTVILDTTVKEAVIYYTLDGSEPGPDSQVYREPLLLTATATLRAQAIAPRQVKSDMAQARFEKADLQPPAETAGPLSGGLDWSYYELPLEKLPDFNSLTPAKRGISPDLTLAGRGRDDFFAFRFSGLVDIPRAGIWEFALESDDGSLLLLDGRTIIDHDGLHGAEPGKSGAAALAKGLHTIEVLYFEREGDQALTLKVRRPGGAWEAMPAGWCRRPAGPVTAN